MNQIYAIAQNTFREAVRNRIFASLILFAVVMLGAAFAMSSGSMNEEVRLMKDVGLFFMSTSAVAICIFIGVNLVYKELERKTIYTIMPKPIYRTQFLLGKYLGLAFTMLVLVSVMGAVLGLLLLAVGEPPGLAMLQAFWLIYVEVLVVTALALFFSSFSTPFLSGLMALGVFVLGRFVDVLLSVRLADAGQETSFTDGAETIVKAIAVILPDLSIYNLTPHVVYARPITFEYLASATLSGLSYAAIGLFIASVLFSRRDFV